MPVRIRGHVTYPKKPANVDVPVCTRPELATSGRPWLKSEIEIVRALYKSHGSKFLAARLNRPFRSIQMKAANLGISKVPKSIGGSL